MSASTGFKLSPSVSVAVDHLGREREPLLIVDDVLEDPKSLIDYAALDVSFSPAWTAKGGYPGVSAPAPLNYVERLARSIHPLLERAFSLSNVKLASAQCRFSMVTLEPHMLTPAQRVPHIDTTSPLQFALLHYLCGKEHGGTAFYRHRATGFETLRDDRIAEFESAREAERWATPPVQGYIRGDSDHFEQIGRVEARFNRLAVYRSNLLHSGEIPSSRSFSDNPRTGRLTANIFLNYRPR